jgi:beta-lactamase regulating signal transducer with metallopeptidase domain
MLQSIGFMAVLCLIFEGLVYLFKANSKQQYIIAIGLQLFGLIHFVFEFFNPNQFVVPNFSLPLSNVVQWLSLTGGLYLVMFGFFLVRFVVHWVKLTSLKSTADYEVATELNDWINQVSYSNEFSHLIKIGVSNKINSPITFGWFEPIILLPIAMLNQLSTAEIKFILLHEMAHILRHDFKIHLALELVNTVLWFNPFANYLNHKIQLEREKSCDEWVVAQTKEPLLYTKALYQLAKHTYFNKLSLSLAAVENNAALLLRIQHMNGLLSKNTVKNSLPNFLIVIGGAILLLFNIEAIPTKSLTVRIDNTPIQQSIPSKVQTSLSNNKSKKFVIKSSKSNSTRTTILKEQIAVHNVDSSYQQLVSATLKWIKSREENGQNNALFSSLDQINAETDYTIAEQLLFKAVIHSYELKRTILVKAIEKANGQNDPLEIVKHSKEWATLQQYEKWAAEYLKRHPFKTDTTVDKTDF